MVKRQQISEQARVLFAEYFFAKYGEKWVERYYGNEADAYILLQMQKSKQNELKIFNIVKTCKQSCMLGEQFSSNLKKMEENVSDGTTLHFGDAKDLKLDLAMLDFKSLFGKTWLTSPTVEMGIEIVMGKFKNLKCASLMIHESDIIFNGSVLLDKSLLHKISSNDVIIAPIYNSHHYSVAVIDKLNKSFYYMNSSKSSTVYDLDKRKQYLLNSFYKFAEAYDLMIEGILKIDPLISQKQEDNDNCGIFTISNVELLLHKIFKRRSRSTISPAVERFLFQKYVMDNLIQVCIICQLYVKCSVQNLSPKNDFICHLCKSEKLPYQTLLEDNSIKRQFISNEDNTTLNKQGKHQQNTNELFTNQNPAVSNNITTLFDYTSKLEHVDSLTLSQTEVSNIELNITEAISDLTHENDTYKTKTKIPIDSGSDISKMTTNAINYQNTEDTNLIIDRPSIFECEHVDIEQSDTDRAESRTLSQTEILQTTDIHEKKNEKEEIQAQFASNLLDYETLSFSNEDLEVFTQEAKLKDQINSSYEDRTFSKSLSQENELLKKYYERDNRKLKHYIKEFHDTGERIIWKRSDLNKILDKNKKLIRFKAGHVERMKFETLEEQKQYTTFHDLVRHPNGSCKTYIKDVKDFLPTKKKERTITILARCIFITCKRFIFRATFDQSSDEDVVVTVLQDMAEVAHFGNQVSQVRGKQRIVVQEKLLKNTPRDYIRQQVDELYDVRNDFEKDKNLRNVISDSACRQIASEGRQKLRADKDVFQSLMIMSKNPTSCIIRLHYKNCNVILTTIKQMRILRNLTKRNGPIDAHFDATGACWKSVTGKNILLFSLIAPVYICSSDKKRKIFPIANFFTESSFASNIGVNLKEVIGFFNNMLKIDFASMFRTITIDFSIAEMSALMKELNLMTITQYLTKCEQWYEDVQKGKTIQYVKIKLCSSHITKCMYKYVDKYITKADYRNMVCKIVIASFLNTTSLDRIYQVLDLLIKYLLSESQEIKNNAYEQLNNLTKIENGKYDNPQEDPLMEEKHKHNRINDQEYKTIYESSPFYRRGLELFSKIKTEIQISVENDKLCTFIEKFLKIYFTFLPLWTPILTFKNFEDKQMVTAMKLNRSNNGAIEEYHKDIKAEIHRCTEIGDKNLVRVDDYILHVHDKLVNNFIKKYELEIPCSRNSKVDRQTPKHEIIKFTSTPVSTTKNINQHSQARKCIDEIDTPMKSTYESSTCQSNSTLFLTRSSDDMRISQIPKTRETFKKRKSRKKLTFFDRSLKPLETIKLNPERQTFEMIIDNSTLSPINAPAQRLVSNRTDSRTTIPKRRKTHETFGEPTKKARLSPIYEEDVHTLNRYNANEDSNNSISIDKDEGMEISENQFKIIKNVSTVSLKNNTFNSLNLDSTLYGLDSRFNSDLEIGFDDFHPNGLIKNLNYYAESREACCDEVKIALKRIILQYGDIKTLFASQWKAKLNNFLVDFYTNMIIQLNNSGASFSLCCESPELFGLSSKKKKLRSTYLKICNSTMFIMPILHNNHFTVAIIDVHKKVFCYYDSSKRNNANLTQEMYIKLLNVFDHQKKHLHQEEIRKVYLLLSSLKPSEQECMQQNDGTSCGVYALINIKNYVSDLPIIRANFETKAARQEILNDIICNSDSVKDMCAYCGLIEGNEISADSDESHQEFQSWLQCDRCQRWWHDSCANKTNLSEYLPFHCIMCKDINFNIISSHTKHA